MRLHHSVCLTMVAATLALGCGRSSSTSTPMAVDSGVTSLEARPDSVLFRDDFNGPDAKRIDPLKWSMWSNSEVSLIDGRAAEPSADNPYGFALAKDLLVTGNFKISANYALQGDEKLGKYVKLWAICGPNVTIATKTFNGGKDTKVYQANITVNPYLQRLSEVWEITPPVTATSNKKVVGSNSPARGSISLSVDKKEARVIIDDKVAATFKMAKERVDHKCRVVFGLRQFTIDNFTVTQQP